MGDLLMWYRAGGVAMHLVLMLTVLGGIVVPITVVVAMVSRFSGKAGGVARAAAMVGVLFALAPCCAGAFGYQTQMWRVDAAVAGMDPEIKSEVLRWGGEEASHNISFGLGSALCMLLPAVLAFVLAPSKPPPEY